MPAPGARTILHVDMDAFYASVEQLDRPEWAGRPVIVGADPDGGRGRGVVAACSYEARRFGVHSALPIRQAFARCPQAVFVRPRMARYGEVSRRVFAIFADFTDLVEPLSIDEAFLDVTGSLRLHGCGETIGRELKRRVRGEVGLVASVGVAPNKFLAKVASDLGKPDGFVAVPPGGGAAFLAPLPLARLWGVGPKTEERLRGLGLRVIGDLARLRPGDLAPVVGDGAADLLALARGEDERPVVPESAPKSVGAETTFDEDTADPEALARTLLGLSERVATRLRREGLRAGHVTLKHRDAAFRTATRSAVLAAPTDLGEDLYRAALELLGRVPAAGRKVRLLGVTAGGLAPAAGPVQPDLFEGGGAVRRRDLARAVDAIRDQFGGRSITRAALLEAKREG